jgi:hypothetical protein
MSHDPRITLARPDLADLDLQGLVAAARYETPKPRQVAIPTAALRKAAHPMAEQWDQLLFGELFRVLDVKAGFAWGQAARDGYVGYVAEDDLAALGAPATHQVAVPRTYAFAEPNIKSRPVGLYSLNALTAVEATEGRFAKGEGTGWFVAAHLTPVGVALTDHVAVAEGYLGAPYQWGATPTCNWRSSRRSPRASVGAAIWCSGRATWPSCWTPRPSCTPTPTTWRWWSSRWPKRAPESRRRAAAR